VDSKRCNNPVDELSKWYVRRSRRRFWKSEADLDKKAGYTTLYTCLTTIIKLLAPFLPFLTEEMYQTLVRSVNPKAPESVHHNEWPLADMLLIDEKLMADMDLTVKVCSLGRSARNKAGIKLRQPLQEARIVAEKTAPERLHEFTDLIKDELNVKELVVTTQKRELITYGILLLPSLLGKKYGKLFPKLCATVATMDADALIQTLHKNQTVEVKVDGRAVFLLPEEVEVRTQPKEGYVLAEEQGIIVGVSTVITEELEKEGLARDIVRRIQNQRKDAGFEISDQIETYYEAGVELAEVFNIHGDYIATETLSTAIHNAEPPENAHEANYEIDGESLRVGLVRKK
jgi:isoleucyl-tRNA synthetase